MTEWLNGWMNEWISIGLDVTLSRDNAAQKDINIDVGLITNGNGTLSRTNNKRLEINALISF